MPRRVPYPASKLDDRLDTPTLIRELNRRFGQLSNVLGDYPEPYRLTYGATVTIPATAAEYFLLTVTNGVGFTVANPTNLAPGQPLAIEILNSSGGALGAVTFGSMFSLAGAFVGPATTKRRVYAFQAVSISSLIEQYRSVGDI